MIFKQRGQQCVNTEILGLLMYRRHLLIKCNNDTTKLIKDYFRKWTNWFEEFWLQNEIASNLEHQEHHISRSSGILLDLGKKANTGWDRFRSKSFGICLIYVEEHLFSQTNTKFIFQVCSWKYGCIQGPCAMQWGFLVGHIRQFSEAKGIPDGRTNEI